MGVQESLNTVYAEMVNRWTKLTGTADPNTISGYDGAPIGITYVRTGTDPVVVWIKNRAGAAGWDLYNPGGTISVGGDLSGTLPNPTVDGLQGRAVAATAPADTNVLTWNAGAAQWQPAAAGGGGNKQSFVIVGNSPAGDTADMCDYLDTGNGAQLAAAIAYASGKGITVFVRAGVYDMSSAGAPATLITIQGCNVVGCGVAELPVPTVIGNRKGVEIRTRTAGVQSLFSVAAQGLLANMRIKVKRPTAACTGTYIVQVTGSTLSSGSCENVFIEMYDTVQWTTTEINRCPNLLALFDCDQGGTPLVRSLYGCAAQQWPYGSSYPYAVRRFSAVGGRTLTGIRCGTYFYGLVENCLVGSCDYGIHCLGKATIINCTVLDSYTTGIRIESTLASPRGRIERCTVTDIGVDAGMFRTASISISSTGNNWLLLENSFIPPTVTSGYGNVVIDGDNVTIQQNEIGVASGTARTVTLGSTSGSCTLLDNNIRTPSYVIQNSGLANTVLASKPCVVVGNALAGDTLSVCDFLDIGDGAQLSWAITQAVIKKIDVCVRPGIYNLGFAGSPADLATITGIRVFGQGGTGAAAVEFVARTSGGVIGHSVVGVGANGSLENIRITIPPPTASMLLSYAVRSNGQGMCKNVSVVVSGTWTNVQLANAPNFNVLFSGVYNLTQCTAIGNYSWTALIPGRTLTLFETTNTSGTSFDQCVSSGGDRHFVIQAGVSRLVSCSGSVRVVNLIGSGTTRHVVIYDCSLTYAPVGSGLLIDNLSDNIIVIGNRIYGASVVDGANCVFIGNNLEPTATVTFTASSSGCQWGFNSPSTYAPTNLGVGNTKPSMVAL